MVPIKIICIAYLTYIYLGGGSIFDKSDINVYKITHFAITLVVKQVLR